MKSLWRFLLLGTLVSFMSSCSALKVLYWTYKVSQNSPLPQHGLEKNGEYEVLWNISNITVTNGYGVGMVGAPGRIIIHGWKDYTFPTAILIGLDSINGDIIWTVPRSPGGNIITHGDIVYRGTVGKAMVQSYKIENGDFLWASWLPWSHSVTNIYYADNKIFAYTGDFDFYVLNGQGKIIDHFRETERIYLEIDGILYMDFFEDGYGIQAVDYYSRKVIWRLRLVGTPIFDNGTIFLATNTDIISINQTTGIVNWKSSQNVLSNLCILNEKIYFVSEDSSLVALVRETGNEFSEVSFSPSLNFYYQDDGYFIAGDPLNNLIAVSFGDNGQIMGLRLINP